MSTEKLPAGVGLEDWLVQRPASEFPRVGGQMGDWAYPQRYAMLRDALKSVQERVEVGALLASVVAYQQQLRREFQRLYVGKSKKKRRWQLLLADPFVYLNGHGPGHVACVMDRAADLLRHFDSGHLSGYELFLLLCSIQIHDVGNVYGRAEHEKKCGRILDEKCGNFLPDRVERNSLIEIARVHSGIADGNLDTISSLPVPRPLRGAIVRERVLAAILRMADEMADDESRADRQGLDEDELPKESVIYHRYSEALHSVNLERPDHSPLTLRLCFDIDSSLAGRPMSKGGSDRYLLDEVYDRTLKVERERRYCMRFLRPHISLERVRVEIVVTDTVEISRSKRIDYNLEETGYPSQPIPGNIREFASDVPTGIQEAERIRREWTS